MLLGDKNQYLSCLLSVKYNVQNIIMKKYTQLNCQITEMNYRFIPVVNLDQNRNVVRCLDQFVDDLARGSKLEKILRVT